MTTSSRKPRTRPSTTTKSTPDAATRPATEPASVPVRPPIASKPGKASDSSASKSDKAEKVKKPKMVRDSFTFPKDEYAGLEQLKLRALKLAHPIKKGELLRAGVMALSAMPDATFLRALRNVPTLKTGRPKKA